jgi:hypothetical protein
MHCIFCQEAVLKYAASKKAKKPTLGAAELGEAKLLAEHPFTGKLVRFVSESSTKRLFGKDCTCEAVIEKAGGEIFVKVKDGIVPFERPLAEVQLTEELAKKQNGKTLRQLDKATAWRLCLDLGFGSLLTTETEMNNFHNELAGSKAVRAWAAHITLWWKFLQWSLEAPSEVVCIPVELLAIYHQTSEEDGYDTADALAKQEAAIKNYIWKPWKLLLVPIYGARLAAEHFTLLVVDKQLSESPPVLRCYDTLEYPDLHCLSRAEHFLNTFVSVNILEGASLERSNFSRQGQLACGFAVCWYIEEELRYFRKEGFGARGWLFESKQRADLHNLTKHIHKSHFQILHSSALVEARMESFRLNKLRRKTAAEKEAYEKKEQQQRKLKALEELLDGMANLPPLLDEKWNDLAKELEALNKAKKEKKLALKKLVEHSKGKKSEEAVVEIEDDVVEVVEGSSLESLEAALGNIVSSEEPPLAAPLEDGPPEDKIEATPSAAAPPEKALAEDKIEEASSAAAPPEEALAEDKIEEPPSAAALPEKALADDEIEEAPSAAKNEVTEDLLGVAQDLVALEVSMEVDEKKEEELQAKKKELLEEIRATRRKQVPELEALATEALPYLTADDQAFVERVRSDGLMICATCRWTSGCWRCDWRKSPRKS